MATRARIRRARDLVIAMLAGAGLAAVAYAMLTRPAPQSISPYYLAHALPDGGGSNVINVVLVDFRGVDTMGEITVLAVVALTIYALLRRFRPPRESISLPRQQRALLRHVVTDLVNPRSVTDTTMGYMMVPAVLVRLLLPIAFVIAAYLFLRGHDEPGGGFVAGLVVAIALLTQYLVAGAQWVEDHVALRPLRGIALGLLVAVLTGAGALVAGYPFLTTHTFHFTVPVLGELHVPSATFFDLGVFVVVLSSTLLILIALAHQSIRSHRQLAEETGDAPAGAAEHVDGAAAATAER